jgi:hydroxymethylglutaryl-CoA reductase
MVVEEPSVIAAVSFMAKLAQSTGGFRAWMNSQEMIGQVQLLDLADMDESQDLIETHMPDLLQQARALNPGLARHGGGIRGLEVRRIDGCQYGQHCGRKPGAITGRADWRPGAFAHPQQPF